MPRHGMGYPGTRIKNLDGKLYSHPDIPDWQYLGNPSGTRGNPEGRLDIGFEWVKTRGLIG